MSKAVGVTLDGVLLMPKLDNYNVEGSWSGKYIDNWFPGYMSSDSERAAYKKTLEVDIDTCLGMISSSGEYYHSSATNCIIGQKASLGQYVKSGEICTKCFSDMTDAF